MSDLNLPPEAQEQLPAGAAAAESEAATPGCACTLFAVVNADGSLARGFGAVSSQNLGTGNYEVIFNVNVRNCAYVATIGLSGSVGASLPGEITVVGRFDNVNGVFITTSSSGGAPADFGFHLAVHCLP